jgi:hypothetical protein
MSVVQMGCGHRLLVCVRECIERLYIFSVD